ncbi:tryptophan synthase beta chain 1 [Olea europaea subsp. europaea]|uniref:Tryptophan synthase beta chain 1 n=1 Tax=Olea europaea subsp. europaea TaxID=158383 RepID=A0A8S0RN84_OLEEU|nr:tryptophan synthase beta chain 1 [Olea europaea subsp. europaea]
MAFSPAASYRIRTHLPSSADSYALLPLKVDKITPPCDLNPKPHSIFCTLAKQQPMAMTEQQLEPVVMQRPDSFGRFGMFGGKYVPETLMYALTELETAFKSLASDQEFQLAQFLFVGKLREKAKDCFWVLPFVVVAIG